MVEVFLVPIAIVSWAFVMRWYFKFEKIAGCMRKERISYLEAKKIVDFRNKLELQWYAQRMREMYDRE